MVAAKRLNVQDQPAPVTSFQSQIVPDASSSPQQSDIRQLCPARRQGAVIQGQRRGFDDKGGDARVAAPRDLQKAGRLLECTGRYPPPRLSLLTAKF